jgi:hypothetical protein
MTDRDLHTRMHRRDDFLGLLHRHDSSIFRDSDIVQRSSVR